MPEIRRISDADVGEVLIAHINSLLDDGKTWDVEQGHKFLSNPDNALFLVYMDGLPVGFLSAYRLQRFDNHCAEVLIYEVGVDIAYRRRGLGKALIQATLLWAYSVGATESWVLTENDNIEAMGLYRITGGELDDVEVRMFTYHWQDDWANNEQA